MRHSNEIHFVTPAGLVDAARIPAHCGLVETDYAMFAEWKHLISGHAWFFNYDPERHAYCIITVPAALRDTPGPTWQLVAAMLHLTSNSRSSRVRSSNATQF